MYDDKVEFLDPITKYDTIDGYLFNIGLLRILFSPQFTLHHVSQDPWKLQPDGRWKRSLRFHHGNRCRSSLEYKSRLESFLASGSLGFYKEQRLFFCRRISECYKAARYYKTPDLDTPKYKILKKIENYKVTQSAHRSSQPEEGRRWLRSSVVIQRESDRRGCAGEGNRIEVCTSWRRPQTARGLLACSVQRSRGMRRSYGSTTSVWSSFRKARKCTHVNIKTSSSISTAVGADLNISTIDRSTAFLKDLAFGLVLVAGRGHPSFMEACPSIIHSERSGFVFSH